MSLVDRIGEFLILFILFGMPVLAVGSVIFAISYAKDEDSKLADWLMLIGWILVLGPVVSMLLIAAGLGLYAAFS